MFLVKWGKGHQGENNKRSLFVLPSVLEHCGSCLTAKEKTASLLFPSMYPSCFPIKICKRSTLAEGWDAWGPGKGSQRCSKVSWGHKMVMITFILGVWSHYGLTEHCLNKVLLFWEHSNCMQLLFRSFICKNSIPDEDPAPPANLPNYICRPHTQVPFFRPSCEWHEAGMVILLPWLF